MTAQSVQVREVISRSQAIMRECLLAELSRALAYCVIANRKHNAAEKLPYLIVAERTSFKFIRLHTHGKIAKSKSILKMMARLEEALGGTASGLRSLKHLPQGASMSVRTEDD
jgi:hypothetical protein